MTELERIKSHCDAIEECYEFMLAYAAQGQADDRHSPNGDYLRQLLGTAVAAIAELPAAYGAVVVALNPTTQQAYLDFLEMLQADATRARAAMTLVLVQVRISSQMIDALNASLHVRSLLTDVFLLEEIVALQLSGCDRRLP